MKPGAFDPRHIRVLVHLAVTFPDVVSVECEELLDAFGADAQEVMTEIRVFEIVDIELITPDFQGQVLDSRGVDIPYDSSVLFFEVLNLLDFNRQPFSFYCTSLGGRNMI